MGVITKLTDAEFLALPDAPGKQELLDGELISLPPAKQRHNAVRRRFFERLVSASPPSRVWMEVGYRLKSGWLQPDVSVTWPDQPCGEWFEGSPMIAIEIASRGNTDEEIDRKMEAYLNEGALEVWIVRPKTVSMTVAPERGLYQTCRNIPLQCAVDRLGCSQSDRRGMRRSFSAVQPGRGRPRTRTRPTPPE